MLLLDNFLIHSNILLYVAIIAGSRFCSFNMETEATGVGCRRSSGAAGLGHLA